MFSASRQLHISKIYSILFFLAPQDKVYSFDVPTYELIYFIRGTCRITFKGHTFTAKKGDLLYLPKCDDDQKYTMEAIEEFALYYISFDTSDDVPDNYSIIHMESDDIKRTYEHFYREWFAKRECYYYKPCRIYIKYSKLQQSKTPKTLTTIVSFSLLHQMTIWQNITVTLTLITQSYVSGPVYRIPILRNCSSKSTVYLPSST